MYKGDGWYLQTSSNKVVFLKKIIGEICINYGDDDYWTPVSWILVYCLPIPWVA